MKKLKLEDYQIIKPYLDMANYEGYNSNFVTMMMWDHEYHIQYEIHDHFLIMLHNYKGTKIWAMPFTTEEFYQEALHYMVTYSHQHHFDFMIDCAIEEFVFKIKNICPNQFIFERTPYNDDYIYDRQALQTLTGKKMQKRRNHYNSFLKTYPDYIFRDLDLVNDFNIILECLTKWEHEKESLSESMTSEVRGILYLLSTQHLLDFKVSGIFINGQMEAFIIASKLKHSTIQIHVEKANKDIRGLYPAILKDFLENHYPDEIYVNKEEDMGLENLRRSKLALHPVKMIHKYRIYEKKTSIQQAHDNDKDDIIKLWKECFLDETEKSTQFYFDYYYQKENTYVLKNNNQLLSALQIVPMTIMKNHHLKDVYFIIGVCTQKNYEGQGCMKELLHFVLSLYKENTIYLQAYIPEIYKSFGFYGAYYHQRINVSKDKLLYSDNFDLSNDYSLLPIYYNTFVQHFDGYKIRNKDDWHKMIKRIEAFDEQLRIFENDGYMIYHEEEKEIYISEFIYLNKEAILKMLSYLKSDKRLILECDLQLDIEGDKEIITTMMSNHIQNDIIDTNLYINEIY